MRELIDKFWAGTATEAEKRQLADAIDQPKSDWQTQLRRDYDEQRHQPEGPLTDEQAKRVLMRLHRHIRDEQIGRDTPFTIWRTWTRWAAAVVLVAGLSIWLYTHSGSASQSVAQHPTKSPWHLTNQTNRSTALATIRLADGSLLTLEPGSSVSYYEPFGKTVRTISLKGEGFFAVAKDAQHPFTVLANGFTTTALGTKFRVRAVGKNRVLVRLLEGRVVVRATPASGLSMTDMYLIPGQEFAVDARSNQVRISSFTPPVSESASSPVNHPTPVLPPGLVFAKEPLETVLNRVSQRYKLPIDFDPADVQGLSFSGSFARSDSLRIVLNAVCLTNNLSFIQEAGRVVVSRSP